MRKFLTARWEDLVMANYEVDPHLLGEYVPSGTDLDLYAGQCFVSVVGFMFLDTRVLGIPVPFHINFAEVNLRFYVRRTLESEVRKAVTFVKEIVPRSAIAFVARTLYGEPYETWKMGSSRSADNVAYEWSKGGVSNWLGVTLGDDLGKPAVGSLEEFIIEHYWGYTRRSATRTDEYMVEHIPWNVCEVRDALVEVDFGHTYGDKFAFLTRQTPNSVIFAKGSPIAVYQGQRIRG